MPILKKNAFDQLNKKCIFFHENNKGTDQSVHPRGLVSAFVIHALVGTIVKQVARKNYFPRLSQ